MIIQVQLYTISREEKLDLTYIDAILEINLLYLIVISLQNHI